MLNDYEKARIVVQDKNNTMALLSERSGMSIARLNQYRARPDELKKAKWIAVHNLAELYDEKELIKLANEKAEKMRELELNELAQLQNLALEGVIVGTATNISDIINEQAKNENMTPSEYVNNYVEDPFKLIKYHDDGTVDIDANGVYVLNDSNLDAIDQIDLLGKRTVFRDLFTDSLRASELVEQINDKYFD